VSNLSVSQQKLTAKLIDNGCAECRSATKRLKALLVLNNALSHSTMHFPAEVMKDSGFRYFRSILNFLLLPCNASTKSFTQKRKQI
jgi:hypothetical protein